MWPTRRHHYAPVPPPPRLCPAGAPGPFGVPPPPVWWQAGFCAPPRAPDPDPVLEAKWDKRIAALPLPWPSWRQRCGWGGYCYDRAVPPHHWYPPRRRRW